MPDGSGTEAGDISVFFEGDHTLILMRGDIDLSLNDDLEYAGREAIDAALPIVADVRKVDLIDSVGLSFLVRLAASARQRGQALSLWGPSPRVEELLGVIGAQELFTWVDGPAPV